VLMKRGERKNIVDQRAWKKENLDAGSNDGSKHAGARKTKQKCASSKTEQGAVGRGKGEKKTRHSGKGPAFKMKYAGKSCLLRQTQNARDKGRRVEKRGKPHPMPSDISKGEEKKQRIEQGVLKKGPKRSARESRNRTRKMRKKKP